jgi:hypothetical protein
LTVAVKDLYDVSLAHSPGCLHATGKRSIVCLVSTARQGMHAWPCRDQLLPAPWPVWHCARPVVA